MRSANCRFFMQLRCRKRSGSIFLAPVFMTTLFKITPSKKKIYMDSITIPDQHSRFSNIDPALSHNGPHINQKSGNHYLRFYKSVKNAASKRFLNVKSQIFYMKMSFRDFLVHDFYRNSFSSTVVISIMMVYMKMSFRDFLVHDFYRNSFSSAVVISIMMVYMKMSFRDFLVHDFYRNSFSFAGYDLGHDGLY